MPRSENQKLKLLYLLEIFNYETDKYHGITIDQIIDKLSFKDISVERRTLYKDIEELRTFGLNIKLYKNKYYLIKHKFSLAEAKLLSDAINSANFISEKTTHTLINKIKSLVSRHEAKYIMENHIFLTKSKATDDSIYYKVNELSIAMQKISKLNFNTLTWILTEKRYIDQMEKLRQQLHMFLFGMKNTIIC